MDMGEQQIDSERHVVHGDEMVMYQRGSLCRIWHNEQCEDYPAHKHSALEIIMPEENIYTVKIARNSYVLNPTEILFIPPGTVHTIMAPSSGTRFIYLMNVSRFISLRSFSSIMSILSQPLRITPEAEPQLHEQLYSILLQMNREYFGGADYSDLYIPSQLLNMFVLMGRSEELIKEGEEDVETAKHREYAELFNDSMKYVDEHFTEKLSLDEMSARSGFSKFHFSRLFKKYTGYNFSDYLCERRVNEAKMMLLSPETSITDVAISSGFSSISTFNRVFKVQTGLSPSEFRQVKRDI